MCWAATVICRHRISSPRDYWCWGMGRGHIPYEGTRVVAICDVEKLHLDRAKNMIDYSVKTFHDFRELIALPEVDIVHIATPPHWHGLMSVEAAKAGKDICAKNQ